MNMNVDVIDGLEAVGYNIKDEDVEKAVEDGVKSIEFTNMVAWLSKQLQIFMELEAVIHPISDLVESDSFLLEVSSFLKELSCPYNCLTEGSIDQRLEKKKNRLILLVFLLSELRASHILYKRKQRKKYALEIQMNQSDTAKNLSQVIQVLGLKTATSDPNELFQAILNEVQAKNGQIEQFIPILQACLTNEQWEMLEKLYGDLYSEYKTRRETMLRRLDVTLASFQWDKDATVKEKLTKIMQKHRSRLRIEPSVEISDLLAACDDLLIMEKTSSANVVRNSSVHKVVIGHVPDRGGRPKEQRPPVEMPGFSRRVDRGGGRGGFHNRPFQRRGSGGRGDNRRWKLCKNPFETL